MSIVCTQIWHYYGIWIFSADMNKHIHGVHEKIKNHKCDICEKEFAQLSSLKKHVDDVHLKIKDFKCKYCDAAYNQHKKLLDHLLGYHKISKLRLGLEWNK